MSISPEVSVPDLTVRSRRARSLGSGTYYIGAFNTLTVGSNNLSTKVSGVIADDCGCLPGPGSLEKVGTSAC